jgi:hypothetical protein
MHFDYIETTILPLVCFKHHEKNIIMNVHDATQKAPKIIPNFPQFFFRYQKKSMLKKEDYNL